MHDVEISDVLLYEEVFTADCFDEPAVLLMRLRCE